MSFAVVALALALRIAWVLAVPTKPVGDFAMYVEAAAHLVEHGSFDLEYVYMPGYILLIAPVQALGGGWLAIKLVGAILGGLGAGAVIGVARRLAGGSARVATIAGLLYAVWPAGIAIASVTGTDMPAAVLVLVATYFLLRFAPQRPVLAAVLFGIFTGLGAYIRAIVVPLAALSVLVFRAHGKPWRASVKAAAIACAVATLMLSPWAVRNRLRYGETFFTDSHGGLTALVGANPNTDGCYSRSLNRMFRDVTGFTLLAEPHRQADRAALAIAKDWTSFEPLFTVGLWASKAERLLTHERALLYWPIFRAGVLPDPLRDFFAQHQAAIEAVADGFWLCVLALALMGCGIAFAQRRWLALALLPQAVALTGLYATIFAEQRYRLPICMLLLPLSALALDWIYTTARGFVRGSPPPVWKREAALAAGLAAFVFAAAPTLAYAAGRLREKHRWAVHECKVAGHPQFCAWRVVASEGARDGVPGVRGVWDGVGLALPPIEPDKPTGIMAETEIALAPGDYALAADLELIASDLSASEVAGTVNFLADGLPVPPRMAFAAIRDDSRDGHKSRWQTTLRHGGGPLRLRVQIETPPGARDRFAGRVWLGGLHVEQAGQP